LKGPAAIGCAILAAGAARRFGGLKLLADVGGVPLLARVAGEACRSCCDRVAVVLGADAGALAMVLGEQSVERLENDRWDEGMSSSIHVAVKWARRRDLEALVLVVADQSRLDAGHLDTLVAVSRGGTRIAASYYAGVLGVPAVFPRAVFPKLSALSGDAGARTILRRPGAYVVPVSWPAGAFDIDRREDMSDAMASEP
jgi:molybdenum cofactor cytidylyltransferase